MIIACFLTTVKTLKGRESSVKQILTIVKILLAASCAYSGASTSYAGIPEVKTGSAEYLNWVKDAMIFMILPGLKQLLGIEKDL